MLRFWSRTDPVYVAPEKSEVNVFVKVFAPTAFRDTIQFVWEYDDQSRGWVSWGPPVELPLTGGNETGYRTFSKSHLSHEGTYRVRVLTKDGREIGRESFEYARGAEPHLAEVID